MEQELPQIKQATFVCSSSKISQLPDSKLPEYALIGRSNVGKSSLINALTNNKQLAKVSNKPGKTKLINHFLIDETWHLVDLPGYGYAKVSKSDRQDWFKTTEQYLLKRQNLVCVFVLLDLRLPLQKLDADFMEWLGTNQIPFCIIYTKRDKLNKNQATKQLEVIREELMKTWEELPPEFVTSSEKKLGLSELIDWVVSTNANLG